MRTLFLTVVAAGFVAWTGFPVPQDLRADFRLLHSAQIAASVRAVGGGPIPGSAERLRESGSMAVLASVLFGASMVVNRRRSPRH